MESRKAGLPITSPETAVTYVIGNVVVSAEPVSEVSHRTIQAKTRFRYGCMNRRMELDVFTCDVRILNYSTRCGLHSAVSKVAREQLTDLILCDILHATVECPFSSREARGHWPDERPAT